MTDTAMTFQQATSAFMRAAAITRAIVAATPLGSDLGDDWAKADLAADAALNAVLVFPAENLPQAAIKLALLASHHDLSDCGCDAAGVALLVSEIARFAAVTAMTRETSLLAGAA